MANNVQAFIPQLWANETVAILEENMVIAGLVHRDFEDQFAKYGDTVNTRQPSELKAVRKAKTTGIAIQDVNATNIPVVLDQHVTVSFAVHDLERTLSLKDLIETYMMPAALALGRNVDRVILGQAARWVENGRVVGNNLGDTYENLVDGKVFLDKSKCYPEGRNVIMTPTAQGKLLKNKQLFPVYAAGTDAVVKKGYIGELADFKLFMAQNQMDVPNVVVSGTSGQTLTTAASPQGSTLVTIAAGANPALAAGQIAVISGSMYTIATAPSAVTFTTAIPLRDNVPVGAVVWIYNPALAAGTYAAGYVEAIAFTANATNVMPGIGSIVRVAGQRYTIVETGATANTFLFDRPLADPITTGDLLTVVNGSQVNFAFHRNALTAAIRPLAPVPDGAGVLSATASYKGLSLRSSIGYNMTTQQLQVTLDLLMGVKVLDLNLGAVILT